MQQAIPDSARAAQRQLVNEQAKSRRQRLRDENRQAARTVLRHRAEDKSYSWQEDRHFWFELEREGLKPRQVCELGQFLNLPKRVKRYWWLKRATPEWADLDKIKEVYSLRDSMNEDYPESNYEVDHVIPLMGELVCGLHVHNNLQILPRENHLVKGRKFEVS